MMTSPKVLSAENEVHLYLYELEIYFGPLLERELPSLWAEVQESLQWFGEIELSIDFRF
jgi:hypothetical protein